MNRRLRNWLAVAMGLLVLALAVWWLVSEQARNFNAAPTGAAVGEVAHVAEGASLALAKVEGQTNQSPVANKSLAQRLADANQADRTLLLVDVSKLPAAAQWDILSDPRVRDLVWARELRKDALSNCSLLLQTDEAQWSDLLKSKELVRDWCAGLVAGRAREQMHGELLSLSRDQQLLESQMDRGTYLDRSTLDAGEIQAYDESLLKVLREQTDPLFVYSAMRDLVSSVQSPLWSGREHEYSAMSRFERGNVGIALAQMVACQKAGGCGPNSVHTISYCATYPWLRCSRGEGLDDILRNNFSPAHAELLRRLSRRAMCLANSATGAGC